MSDWKFSDAQGLGTRAHVGFAHIEESNAGGVESRTRVYEHLPPSSHLIVTPVGVDAAGFADGSRTAPSFRRPTSARP